MEIVLIIIAIIIGIGLLIYMSGILAFGSLIAAIYYFIQGHFWAGIGFFILFLIFGALSAFKDDDGPTFIILKQ